MILLPPDQLDRLFFQLPFADVSILIHYIEMPKSASEQIMGKEAGNTNK